MTEEQADQAGQEVIQQLRLRRSSYYNRNKFWFKVDDKEAPLIRDYCEKHNLPLTEYFKTLKDSIVLNEHFPWCRINELNVFQTTENRDVYFAHMIYQHHTPKTQEHNWNLVVPFLSQLEKTEKMHALIRVKVNYYNSTPEVVEHCKHYDYPAMPLPHKGAILYLNTND